MDSMHFGMGMCCL